MSTKPKARTPLGTQRVGPVELPRAVTQALADNKLVLFVGAGASKASPSDLPLFDELVCQIVPGRKPEVGEPFENFLGRLKDEGTDVHRLVASLIGRPESKPNEIHQALGSLFASADAVRVVTTNFDRHLEGAIQERWQSIPVYDAPALPLGNRFQGIVHLHGGLGPDPSTLVVTDADYGRAYLTEGWARRFVIKLFEEFVVLFVGYSYGDAPLKYIARGLPADFGPGRFALTDRSEADWNYLGITPILYDSVESHRQVREVLGSWSTLARRGALDAEGFVAPLCERGPDALDPSEEGSLLYYLSRHETAHLFYRHAKHADWLEWAERHDLLAPLFEPGCVDETFRELAWWFSTRVLGPRGDVALRIAWKRHFLSPLLASSLSRAVGGDLANENDKTRDWGRRAACWLQLILSRCPLRTADPLLGLGLLNLCPENQAELAVWWFRFVATPEFVLEQPWHFAAEGGSRLELDRKRQALADLARPWEKLFQPNLDRFAPLLLPSLTAILSEVSLALRASGSYPVELDPTSLRCSSIARHSRGSQYRSEPIGVLISAVRDVFDWHLRERPRVAAAIVEIWLESEAPLLRRFGLYGLARVSSSTSQEKLLRLLDLSWFGNHSVEPELHEVTQSISLSLDSGDLQRLIDAGFEAHESLRCLDQVGQGEEHEDDSEDEGVWIEPESPFAADRVKAMSPERWFEAFNKIAEAPLDFNSVKDFVRGFLEATQEVAVQDLSFGFGLAEALRARGDFSHSAWIYLLRAWGKASLDEASWLLLESLCRPLSVERAHEFIDFLNKWSENQGAGTAPRARWLSVVSMAERLWEQCSRDSTSFSESENQEWLTEAINSPAGKLAEVVLRALTNLREDPEARGVPHEVLPLLAQMCAPQEYPEELAACVLASRLRYLRWLDEDWAREHLERRFDWTHERHATQAWHGFLHGYSDTSFLPLFVSAFPNLGLLGPIREDFVRELVDLAYHFGKDPYSAGWLRDFLVHSNLDDRRHFSWAVEERLKGLNPEQRAELWRAWLANYFKRRFVDPPPLEDAELAIFCDWARHLGPFLGEFLVEFEKRKSPGGSSPGGDLFFLQMREQPIEGDDATTGVRFCQWVLSGLISQSSAEEAGFVIEYYIDRGADTKALASFIDLYVAKRGTRGAELRGRLRARDEKQMSSR